MAIGRIGRGLAWAAGGTLLLPLLAYLVLLAINASDRPPSPEARRLTAVLDARPAVPDAANGYVDLPRLSAMPDTPGRDAQATRTAARPGRAFDVAAVRAARRAALGDACDTADRACADALPAREAHIDALLADEAWLLQRYRTLIDHPAWQEPLPADLRSPLPEYAPVLEAQRLLHLAAWRQARRGDDDAVRDLLDRDARFWRTVLASSDLLISKMIATAALQRNLAFGALALRALPAERVAAAVPATWQREIGREERSFLRVFAGEWHSGAGVVRASYEGRDPLGDAAPGRTPRARLARPLLKVQDTLNRQARRFVGVADAFDVPLADYPQAQTRARREAAATEPAWRLAYNPIGRILASIAAPAYLDYLPRVADLEGRRRAALLLAALHAGGVDAARAPAAVAASTLRDPYTGAAFGWDAGARAVVVTGLGRDGRVALPF